MSRYDKSFREEAIKLSCEVGVKTAAEQLGIPYDTVSKWRSQLRKFGPGAGIGSGHRRVSGDPDQLRIKEPENKISELQRANDILREALGFFAASRKK